MGNTRNTGYLGNIIKVSDTGNITFVSGSTVLMSVSSSGQLSGSVPALSASYAATSSFANALNVAGTLTATTLVVQTITSSVDFVTGSTRFGTTGSNTHIFTGSVSMYGGNTGVNPVLSLKADTYGLLGISRGTQTNSSAGVNYFTGTSQKWFAGIYENSDNFGFYSVAYGGFPMVIASGSGNVGIGTSNPNKALEIQSTAEQLRLSYNSTTYTDIRSDSAGGLLINAGANYIINYIGSSEKMRITSAGNVGIGTNGPNNLLSVRGNLDLGDTGYAFQGGGQYGGITFPRGQLLFSNSNSQNQLYAMSNAYLNTNTWYYRNSAVAVGVAMDNGTGFLQAAPSGTANNSISFTNALTWDTNGVKMKGGSSYLSYYEEGSWTPSLLNATVSYTYRSGTYVRIGNWVFVRWGFLVNSISGQSGVVTISGLPFTAASYGSYQEPNISVSTGNLVTADLAQRARVYKGNADNNLYGRIANNGDTTWNTDQIQASTWIIGEIYYNV